MYWLTEGYIALRDFMESGGPVLWYIALLVTFMWALILERVYYFLFQHDEFAENIRKRYYAMKFTLRGINFSQKRDSYLKESFQSIEIFNSLLCA